MTPVGGLRGLLQDRSVMVAASFLVFIAAIAVLAPVIAPHDPATQLDPERLKNVAPSAQYLLGTDSFSRDVLSRLIHGTRISLTVGFAAALVALTIGTIVGAVAGFVGGATDRWLMRAVDVLLSIPRLLILLVLAAALGRLPLMGLVFVIGLTGWPGVSRLVRAQVREIAELDYVMAARALGVRPLRILVRHVLPGVLPQVLVAATLAVAAVIPLEATLSFLGFGIPVPQPSWGNIIVEGYDQNLAPWWLVVFPGIAIVTTVLAINVIGERLRESFDPRLRPPV
jgi:peptide/nickel transport system permease protein